MKRSKIVDGLLSKQESDEQLLDGFPSWSELCIKPMTKLIVLEHEFWSGIVNKTKVTVKHELFPLSYEQQSWANVEMLSVTQKTENKTHPW